MKNIRVIRSISGRKISGIKLIFAATVLLSLISCSTEEINADPQVELKSLKNIQEAKAQSKAASSNTTIETVNFTATALIAHCHGENIQFTGEIENRVSTTTDAKGVIHYTRSFTTRGMTGIGISPETGLPTGTEYDVLGGAEMFAIKDAAFTNGNLNLSGSISQSDLVIHQGTLVFESRIDNSRVVARHIIRKVPGQEEVVNKWICAGK